jgi:hypothetical protein
MKKYIVKQTTNWNTKGEKSATFTVVAATEAQAKLILAELDGKVEVYEMSATLGNPAGLPATTSLKVVDSIKFISTIAKTVYVSPYSRPLVFKTSTNLDVLAQSLRSTYEPFGDLNPSLKPSDVSFDSGDYNKL